MESLALRSPPPLGVLREDGSLRPDHAPLLPGELAVALYEHMMMARKLDERFIELQRGGVVSQHSSALGEEATIIGSTAAMSDDDWVFPSSREVAAALWRGIPLSAYAHHVLATGLDKSRGRNAPDVPSWRSARVASVSPLVGTQIPHAVGFAWAARMRGSPVASLVFFGEGATSTGDFHSGLNFAGVTRAPLVAICRNNGWAMSTPASRQTASPGFAIKSVAYGLRAVSVDGADVVAVLTVVREARRRAIEGLGGTLVEAVIPGIDRVDPLARVRRHLESRDLWSGEREEHLANEVRDDIDRAIAEAIATAGPEVSTLFDDLYAEPPWHLREQRRGQ